MELASQVGEGDGTAAAGEVWVSRRPESAGIGEKLSIRATEVATVLFSRNFKNVKKLLVG